MSYAVTVNANSSLDYVTLKVDGQNVFIDHEELFQFFWNLALWADGSFHTLWADAYDELGNKDECRMAHFIIPSRARYNLRQWHGQYCLQPDMQSSE